MTNLRRYSITAISERFDAALITEDRNILTEHYCNSADVAAIEAENEKLQKTKVDNIWLAAVQACAAAQSEEVLKLRADNERLQEAIKTALVDVAELKAILNREHSAPPSAREKQP